MFELGCVSTLNWKLKVQIWNFYVKHFEILNLWIWIWEYWKLKIEISKRNMKFWELKCLNIEIEMSKYEKLKFEIFIWNV